MWFSNLYWSGHYWLYSVYIAFNLGFHLYLYFSYQLYLCAGQKWKGLQSRALLRWSVLLSAAPPFLLRWEDTDEDNRFSLCICICISFLFNPLIMYSMLVKITLLAFSRRGGEFLDLYSPQYQPSQLKRWWSDWGLEMSNLHLPIIAIFPQTIMA